MGTAAGTGVSEAIRYARSAVCAGDLAVVRELWGGAGVIGSAGLLIFATYAALPELTMVGASAAGDALMLRKVLRDGPEMAFLAQLTGLCADPAGSGGIANPAVRAAVVALGGRHARLTGMRQEYLDVFGAVVALSAPRVRTTLGAAASEAQLAAYWRYMTHALALFGVRLPALTDATDVCACYIQRYSGAGPATHRYVNELFGAYPGHARSCLSALFPSSRAVLDKLGTATRRMEVTS